MAGMKVKQTEYLNTKGILAMADHYVTIGRKYEQATAAGGIVVRDTNTGRLVIKAGTVYPANDKTAIGLVFQDYDVTDGDVNLAIMIHGFVLAEKLPITPSGEALAAMKQISILEKEKKDMTIAAAASAGK